MSKTAEFGARDFILAGLGWRKPHLDAHAGNGVLLHSEVRQEEAVNDVFGAQANSYRLADRNVHDSDAHDVVLGQGIATINSDVIRRSDQFRIGTTELCIGAWIVEVPEELFARDLNHSRVLRLICEID